MKIRYLSILIASMMLLACATVEQTQQENDEPRELTQEDYERAESMLSWNVSDLVVQPNGITQLD